MSKHDTVVLISNGQIISAASLSDFIDQSVTIDRGPNEDTTLSESLANILEVPSQFLLIFKHVMDSELSWNDIEHDFVSNLHLPLLFIQDVINWALISLTGICDYKNGTKAIGLMSTPVKLGGALAHVDMTRLGFNHRLVGKVRANIVRYVHFLPFLKIATDSATKVKYA